MQISWGLARRTAVAGVVLVGLAGAVQASPAAADGNSVAAHACQDGGYTRLVGVQDGQITTFGTAGACVSYAAQGGRLVAASVVQPCLNGGFSDLATSEDNTTPFSSEAACVSYAAGGGSVVSVVDPIIVDPHFYNFRASPFSVGACTFDLNVSGLAPFTTYLFRATITNYDRGWVETDDNTRTTDADGQVTAYFGALLGNLQTVTVQTYDATGAGEIGSPSDVFTISRECR